MSQQKPCEELKYDTEPWEKLLRHKQVLLQEHTKALSYWRKSLELREERLREELEKEKKQNSRQKVWKGTIG